jgi:ribosomal-protein-alanine N-acetyltransferase
MMEAPSFRHVGTGRIEITRLLLRRFELDDAEAMFRNWAHDADVTKYLTWPPHENVEATRSLLEQWVRSYDDPASYNWAITPTAVDKSERAGVGPFGSISVVDMNERLRIASIGYCIGKPWWGQGYTSEALGAVISYLFEQAGFNRIEALHDPRNLRSGHVMAANGMTFEGTLRQRGHSNQGLCDDSIYSVLAEDYFG